MANSKYVLTEKQIIKRIKEGRGSGRLSSYKPWLYVNEVPSKGRSQRVYSHLTGRIHHVLSDLEFAVFLLLDHNPAITDIREQFPLNRDDCSGQQKLVTPLEVFKNACSSASGELPALC